MEKSSFSKIGLEGFSKIGASPHTPPRLDFLNISKSSCPRPDFYNISNNSLGAAAGGAPRARSTLGRDIFEVFNKFLAYTGLINFHQIQSNSLLSAKVVL